MQQATELTECLNVRQPLVYGDAPGAEQPASKPAPAPGSDGTWEAFQRVVHERRAVRYFDRSIESLPDHVVEDCIEMAMLSPSASNLQPWQFFRIKSPEAKVEMVRLCMGLPSVKTASELIVCVGRTDRWRSFTKRIVGIIKDQRIVYPKPFDHYYDRIVPATYVVGPLGLLGLLKRAINAVVRLRIPLSSPPCSHSDMKHWALKNTALATMTLMLALRAKGYDSCPTDSFDAGRVKKFLGLGRGAHIFTVLGVGKRTPEDQAFGSRLRFERDLFLETV